MLSSIKSIRVEQAMYLHTYLEQLGEKWYQKVEKSKKPTTKKENLRS